MIDLMEAVHREHEEILDLTQRLLEEYETGPDLWRSTRKLVDTLVALESRHEAAEARFLWPVVRDALPEYAQLRGAAQAQERRAKRALHRLHKVAGRPESEELAASVGQAIIAHVGVEEAQVLPSLRDALGRSDAIKIGRMYQRASVTGPTRPHPMTPAIPGLLGMAAPMAARMDRLRDFLRIR